MKLKIKNEEHINWDLMGPIYLEQCEALKRLVVELRETITKLLKENNQ